MGDTTCNFDTFAESFYNEFKTETKIRTYADNPWWNVNCNRVKAALIRSLASFKENPSRENFRQYNIRKKEYFYVLRKEKSAGWKSSYEEIDCNITPHELWNKIKKYRGMNLPKPSNMPTTCIDEFCDNIAGPMGPVRELIASPIPSENSGFTMQELDMAISTSKDTSAGFDGIRNGHIKEFNSEVRQQLLNMYNKVPHFV